MDNKKKYVLVIMLLPWLTVPFIGKKALKRFSLTSLFVGLLFGVQSVYANKKGWWRVYTQLFPNVMGEVPFIIGPFFVGAIWILKFTFGKFLRSTLLNLGVDFFHIFVFVRWLQRMGIASLIRLKDYQALILFSANAAIMYGFQWLIDKKVNPEKTKSLIKRILS
ncbi:hypothetical protein [Neobacillus niacini]|uniref:hypothetical protein n=1 Tax=Neobacillus niacini TaxID=86668 RepID=UPI00203F5D1D|nr:hypothetical protein [Neobacillus niacini]MCM3693705.1 hypothetical protein [Neobacillus niacini]